MPRPPIRSFFTTQHHADGCWYVYDNGKTIIDIGLETKDDAYRFARELGYYRIKKPTSKYVRSLSSMELVKDRGAVAIYCCGKKATDKNIREYVAKLKKPA